MIRIGVCALWLFGLLACSPAPGSDAWCEKMSKTPKGDWTMDDTAEYAKSCVLKVKTD